MPVKTVAGTHVKVLGPPYQEDVIKKQKKGRDMLCKVYAAYPDQNGNTKKGTLWIDAEPNDCQKGAELIGALKCDEYEPGQWSFSFRPSEASARSISAAAPPSAQAPQPSVIPYEVREAATRRLLREAYDTTSEVMRGIMVDTPKNKRDSAMVFITASFPEIWKSAIMSLKIEGNVWPDILASEQNKYAESHGMPEDKEMAEPEPVAEVSQPEAAPDDLSDCPF